MILSRRNLLTTLGVALPVALTATVAEAASKLPHHKKPIHKAKATRKPHAKHPIAAS